ncbi:MAG: hypothetical protein ACKPGI_04570 [Verrucomicrobiota bacterium]
MKPKLTQKRYRLFRKGAYGTFYIEDAITRRQTSLKTKDLKEAERLLLARCESAEAPDRAFRVGMAYVGGVDPEAATRTWKDVIDAYAGMPPEDSPTRPRTAVGAPLRRRFLSSTPHTVFKPADLIGFQIGTDSSVAVDSRSPG